MKVNRDFHCDQHKLIKLLKLNTDNFDRAKILYTRSAFSIDMFRYIQYYITLKKVI